MNLKILTPTETKFKGSVISLNIKTLSGDITVLDHHEPLVSMFPAGVATVTTHDNKKTEVPVNAGFLEMTSENELTLLTD